MSKNIRGFEVRYRNSSSSDSKADGFVIFDKSSSRLILKNSDRETIRDGTVDPNTINENSKPGDLLPICGFHIVLVKEIIKKNMQSQGKSNVDRVVKPELTEPLQASVGIKRALPDAHPCSDTFVNGTNEKTSSNDSQFYDTFTCATVADETIKKSARVIEPPVSSLKSSTPSSSCTNIAKQSVMPTLDEDLLRKMQPHQIKAAKFLLQRLLGVGLEGTSSRYLCYSHLVRYSPLLI